MILKLSKKDRNVKGEITLNASKSISNRLLIIQALCKDSFTIANLSNARDTLTLKELLAKYKNQKVLDAGAAGTTFRFLTAFLAFQPGIQVLTGTERMKKRPIGVLVDALRSLGAKINYLDKEGFPPIEIAERKASDTFELEIPANISSQFISAILLIAPTLSNGLKLNLIGKIVSRPYLLMTLEIMKSCGIDYSFEGNKIQIKAQNYVGHDHYVEADWSAASYFYSIAALAEKATIKLNGLKKESTQGDSCIKEIMKTFGVQTTFDDHSILLTKDKDSNIKEFTYNFEHCPDLAQTLSVLCAGRGVYAQLEGLSTLKIKETDRIEALKKELAKFKVALKTNEDSIHQMGKALVNGQEVSTYEDHRMAMAFAPLALGSGISIEDPEVVVKSYPNFWKDLESLDFSLKR